MPGGGSDHSSSSAKPAHGQPFCTQTTLCFLFSVHYLINYTRSSTHYNKRGFALTVPGCRLAKRWRRPGCAMVSSGLYLPHAFWLRTFATYKRFTGLQPHHKLRKIWTAIVPTGSPEQLPQARVGSAGRRAGREDPRWPGRIRDQGGNSTFPETSLRPLKQGLATLTCRLSLLCCLFLYDPQIKDGFWCFLMGGEKSKEDLYFLLCEKYVRFKFQWKQNYLLLEASHVHSWQTAYECSEPLTTKQSWVLETKTMWPAKPEIFTVWPFTENSCEHLHKR